MCVCVCVAMEWRQRIYERRLRELLLLSLTLSSAFFFFGAFFCLFFFIIFPPIPNLNRREKNRPASNGDWAVSTK